MQSAREQKIFPPSSDIGQHWRNHCCRGARRMRAITGAQSIEHAWFGARAQGSLQALEAIEENPGPVMYSILDADLREELQRKCALINIPCMAVLEPFVATMSTYLNVEVSGKPGSQHTLDTDYFQRIAALNYTIQHDDGQSQNDLNEADVILTGVSRTSKTPTCMYLANRGLKAANVPLVPGIDPPEELLTATRPLIVGLTTSPERLLQIRKTAFIAERR